MNPGSLRLIHATLGTLLFSIAVLFCLSFLNLSAQDKAGEADTLAHTLLWRIDGNGLAKPSYLYGTFHTQDPRAFNFRDSVLPALLSCEIAAFELQVDTMFAAMHRKLYYPDSVINLREYLTDEEFDILDERLLEETGLSAEALQYTDPSILHLFLEEVSTPIEEEGNDIELKLEDFDGLLRIPKETFLDAWLFRTARLEGKTVVGLETIEEHIAIMDTIPLQERIRMLVATTEYNPSENIKTWRELVDAYQREDIEALFRLIEQEELPIGVQFKLLTERNRNIADRMAVLAYKGPTFTAVGAAHLAGEEGVIQLLRRKGFSVSPVISGRTGVTKEYKRPKKEFPWYPLTNEKSGFSIETPAPALDIPASMMPSLLADRAQYWYSADLTTGLYFFIIIRSVPLAEIMEKDILSSTQEMWFGDSEDKSLGSLLGSNSGMLMREKDVTVNGIKGKELTGIDTDGDLTRMRIFHHNGKIYLFMVSGGSSLIKSKDDSRFLKSVTFQPSQKGIAWQPVELPNTAKTNVVLTMPEGIQFDTVQSWNFVSESFSTTISGNVVDPSTGIYYVVEQTTMPAESIIRHDSSLLKHTESYAIPESATVIEEKALKKPSWSRAAHTYTHKLESGLTLKRQAYVHGGILWTLTVATPDGVSDPKSEKKFFSSIQLKKKTPSNAFFTDAEQNVKIALKDPMLDSTDYYYYTGAKSWIAGEWDGNRTLSIVCKTFWPWYEAESEEEFFKEIRTQTFDERDSIIAEQTVVENGLNWREHTVLVRESDIPGMRYRERVALHGNRLYRLRWLSIDAKDNLRDADKFFQSFSLPDPNPKGNVFSRKVDFLLQDISSTDSATRARATNALWVYTFKKEDLPKLYEALNRNYEEDTDTTSRTKSRLLQAFNKVHDEESVPTLLSFYNDLPTNHDSRSNVLAALAAIRTDESIRALKDLLKGDLSSEMYPYSVFAPFYDSLQAVQGLYPEVLELASDPVWRPALLRLTDIALDSGAITLEGISTQTENLRTVAQKALEIYRKPDFMTDDDETVYMWEAISAINILGKLPPDREIDGLLRRTLRDDEISVKRATAVALIQHKQNVRSKWITKIVEDAIERINLYRGLKAIDRLDKFPEEYLSQILLSESLISKYLYYEDEYAPEKIEYIADRTVQWNGEEVRGYLFKFRYTSYEEDETGIEDTTATWNTAFCAQPTNFNKFSTDTEMVRVSWDTFDPEKIDAHFQKLMAMREGNYE